MTRKKDIADIVSEIRKGQIVEIIWIDACESRNVSSFENEAFATYKRSIGRFLACKRDRVYNQEYIIIYEEVTDKQFFEITSIPLAVIMDMRVIEESK